MAACCTRMNAALTADTNQATTSTALWRVAAAFMHILHGLFGTPSDVAGQNTLTLKAHRLMALLCITRTISLTKSILSGGFQDI